MAHARSADGQGDPATGPTLISSPGARWQMPFPSSIRALPRSSLGGADVYVHDNGRTQVLFIEVPLDHPEVIVPTHTHDVEWGFVVEGSIEMTLGNRVEAHAAGSTHWIPAQLPHSFRFRPGTSSVHYFIERRVRLPEPSPTG